MEPHLTLIQWSLIWGGLLLTIGVGYAWKRLTTWYSGWRTDRIVRRRLNKEPYEPHLQTWWFPEKNLRNWPR